MKKNVTKHIGLGSTIHTGDIIHQNFSVHDTINNLSETGDIKAAMKLMEDIKASVSRAHPFAPHYQYKTEEYKGKTMLTHQAITPEIANKLPLVHKGKAIINVDDVKSFAELESRLRFGGEKIPVKVTELQSYIGNTKIDDELASAFFKPDNKIFLGSSEHNKNEPFKILASDKYKSNENKITVIDYIELDVTEYYNDNNTMHLTLTTSGSNNLYIDLSFVLRWPITAASKENFPLELKGKYSINVKHENAQSFQANAEMHNILNKMNNRFVTLVHLRKNLSIPIGISPRSIYGKDEEYWNWERDLIPRVLKIEKFYNVDFKFPNEFTNDDLLNIQDLELAMNKKSYSTIMEQPLELEAHSKEGILELFFDKDKPTPLGKVATNDPHEIELFGVVFNNIERVVEFPPLILKDANLIKKRAELMGEGDSIKLILLPLKNKKLDISFNIIKHT